MCRKRRHIAFYIFRVKYVKIVNMPDRRKLCGVKGCFIFKQTEVKTITYENTHRMNLETPIYKKDLLSKFKNRRTHRN